MASSVVSPLLYKYLDPIGARKTLQRRSIKFSRPSELNDPFDVNLEEALGLEIGDFLEGMKEALFDFLCGDIDYSKLRESQKDKIIIMNQRMKNASDEQRNVVKAEMLNTPIEDMYDIEHLREVNRTTAAQVSANLMQYGVFCTSSRNDSLLMWSHYAQQHRGVVLKLCPDAARDSIFLLSRPMAYVRERPLMYRRPLDMVLRGLSMPVIDSTREIIDSLVYTKSLEWEYESELRLACPNLVPVGEKFQLLQFFPQELSAIYLGCRMADEDRTEIVSLGRQVNPRVEIFQAEISKREYALSFRAC